MKFTKEDRIRARRPIRTLPLGTVATEDEEGVVLEPSPAFLLNRYPHVRGRFRRGVVDVDERELDESPVPAMVMEEANLDQPTRRGMGSLLRTLLAIDTPLCLGSLGIAIWWIARALAAAHGVERHVSPLLSSNHTTGIVGERLVAAVIVTGAASVIGEINSQRLASASNEETSSTGTSTLRSVPSVAADPPH